MDDYKLNENHFIFFAELPKSHMYFNDYIRFANQKKYYDSMLVLEIFRQISICVTHKYYAIPFDAKFVFNDANFKVIHHQEFEIKNEPLRVAIDVQIKNQRYRKNILVGYSLSMRLIINDCICAEKEMVIGWMESLVWKKLRSKIKQEIQYSCFNVKREHPLAVGRLNPQNVIIGDCEINNKQLTTTLCIDQTYSPIFDHQLDHVPAMFIIEAFRQSALLAIEKYNSISIEELFFSNCNISFKHFCELNKFANCVISLKEIEFQNGFIKIPIYLLQNNIKNTCGIITFKHIK